MEISLETIQSLAPDQASLGAAKKLLSPAKWPQRGRTQEVNVLWGLCQGSGANPYYVIADVADHGYKCTCPSRKFPCKHILALWWQFAEQPGQFNEAPAPDWVQEWLGRRRKTAAAEAEKPAKPQLVKDIHAALSDAEPAADAAKEAAQAKRSESAKQATQASISAGLEDFALWIDDQLRAGISEFLKQARPKCRQIAARLVDAKAANLASRLDELPARLLQQPAAEQAHWAMTELGQLVWLCQAWRSNPNDADTLRAIGSTETRDSLLQHPELLRYSGTWQTVSDSTETRRDGLIQHNRWLLQLGQAEPRFALLQDYYPASAGRRDNTAQVGQCIEGELAFYPSRAPLRALLLQHQVLPQASEEPWPQAARSPLAQYAQHLQRLPWIEEVPSLLGPGQIHQDTQQHYWWQSADQQQSVRVLNPSLPALVAATALECSAALARSRGFFLLSAQTRDWGLVEC